MQSSHASWWLGAATALLVALVQSSSAEPPPARSFNTQRMTGAQEVPARETSAHGVAVFELNPDETELRYTVTAHIENLVGGHVHSAAPGVNGPIVLPLLSAAAGGGQTNGVVAKDTVVRGVTALPPSLGAGLDNAQRFDALVALLRSGDTYVNLHTDDGVAPTNTGAGDFPGGEIRGQILPRP
jgi:hypothetical protein